MENVMADMTMPELSSFIDFEFDLIRGLGNHQIFNVSVTRTFYVDISKVNDLIEILNIPSPFKDLLMEDLDKYNFTSIFTQLVATTINNFIDTNKNPFSYSGTTPIRFNILTGEFTFIIDPKSENIYRDYGCIVSVISALSPVKSDHFTGSITTANTMLNQWMKKNICTLGVCCDDH